MKKTLALVLAIAMVFSTMTVAFAEEPAAPAAPAALSADAQICYDLGMLKGETGTVDAAYTATNPTRIQAAVMVLRLKGLEDEAKAFTGDANFADADKAAWAKPIMAYLKANPQLGWAGDGTNFNPTNKITAKEYYKVMLEALGYKQSSATVAGGDFAWDNVIAFAAEKGLKNVAAVENFTVNDLAMATVETLKGNVKDTTKTLVASLVEAGKVDKAKATAAGVYVDAAVTTAKLDSAMAVANNKVRVAFDADVEKAFVENVANYKVVVKGSTTALEVKAAVAEGTDAVAVETAAMTAGTAYTLTVGEVAVNFTGIAKETGAPEVDKVTCIDTNTVEIKFTKALDKVSAEDVANYTLNNGATVVKAELWEATFDNRKVVKLTTQGVANNKIYKVKVANVKSADMVAIKSVEKSFAGVADTVAPKLKGNISVKNNQRIIVDFDDKHGLDKAALENAANWTIDGLTINSIIAKEQNELDDYTYYDRVEINTEPMEASKKYTVTVSNLVDGSASKNAIAKSISKTFYGVAVDKNAPKAGTITVLGDSMLEIRFTDTNRLDATTATDISNYTFTEGLTAISAKLLKSSKPDEDAGKTVVLTTSTMDKDTTYKVTIENVADEFGNVMAKVSNRTLARSKGADLNPPVVKTVSWVDDTTVKMYFSERLDLDSANDPANYEISGGIGKVLKAEISSSETNPDGPYTRVTLTTSKMEKNKNYTVTINGVKDRLGNVVSEYKAYFTAGITAADTDRPEIEDVTAINNQEVRVTFNEPLTIETRPTLTIDSNGDTAGLGTNGGTASAVGPNVIEPGTVYDYVYTIDEGKTVVFVLDGNKKLDTTEELRITAINNVKDLAGNYFVVDTEDYPTFYGSKENNDKPEIDSIDQVDVKTLKVYFNEPVLLDGAAAYSTTLKSGYTAYVDYDYEYTIEALSTLTLIKDTNFAYDTKYTFDFSAMVEDYEGAAALNENEAASTEFTALYEDEEAPVIDYIEAVNTNKVKVVYNEDIDAGKVGTYQIVDSEGDKVGGTITVGRDADNYNIVNLTLGTALTEGEVYTVSPKTAAYDIAGNKLDIDDVEFDIVGSGVVPTNYVKGVKIVNPTTVRVVGSKSFAVGEVIAVKRGTKTIGTLTVVTAGSTQTVRLSESLIDGVTYTVDSALADYNFTGISSDGGLDVETGDIVTFSGWNTDNFVVKLVYDADSDGIIVTDEVYFVVPEYNVSDDVYEFVLDTVYQESDNAVTLDFADIVDDSTYEIQVYRTRGALDMPSYTDEDDYQTAYDAVIEGSLIYSRSFTK